MLVVGIPQYLQNITNAKIDLTTTDNTVLYTAPSSADFNASIINSILVSDVSGNATVELLTRDLVLQSGEILKVQAATANRLHVVASVQEFAKTRITTSGI